MFSPAKVAPAINKSEDLSLSLIDPLPVPVGPTNKLDAASNISQIEMTRLKVKKFLAASLLGRAYMNMMLVLSVLSCFQYIYQTYLDPSKPAEANTLRHLASLELGLASLFGFDWCLALFVADHKSEFLKR